MTGVDGGMAPGTLPGRQWDVALSFAGAQRHFVGQVAEALKARGVRCFYDADEMVRLWGMHLAEELPRIYAEESAAVVVFISADYAGQDWTRLERRAAFSRAVTEAGAYLLPARFDDSELPGLLPDVVTVDLGHFTPAQFADLVIAKLSALGIITQTPSIGEEGSTQPRNVVVEERSEVDERNVAGEIKFRQFVPAELGNNCVLPYALDDQWVPRSQLQMMQAEGASLIDLGSLRDSVIRREYLRSLITAERIVINRSFLFRNPVLSAGYTADADTRAAFAELLHDGAIVLFLINEQSPLESGWAKESAASTDAANALGPILRSVRAWCVRFSWEADNEGLIDAWNGRFARRIKRAVRLDHGRFLEDVGASRNDASGFRKQLDLLPRLATPTEQVPITRSNLYTEYIVRDPQDIEQGRYDFTKPYVIPLKWLFDLVYNSNLAAELQLALAAPVDSVHRSVVHSPNFFQDEAQGDGFDPARVRTSVMETIQDALFRRDFSTGALSVFNEITLRHVVTIRKSELWQKYVEAVDVLLEEPWLLPHPERGLLHVYRCYDDLLAFIGKRVTS
jgi:hypothetical protein